MDRAAAHRCAPVGRRTGYKSRRQAIGRRAAAIFRSTPNAWVRLSDPQNIVTLLSDSANRPRPRFFARAFLATRPQRRDLPSFSGTSGKGGEADVYSGPAIEPAEHRASLTLSARLTRTFA